MASLLDVGDGGLNHRDVELDVLDDGSRHLGMRDGERPELTKLKLLVNHPAQNQQGTYSSGPWTTK